MAEHSDEYRQPTTDALRDRIAQAIESVAHCPQPDHRPEETPNA